MQPRATLVAVLMLAVAGGVLVSDGSPRSTEKPLIECPDEVSKLCQKDGMPDKLAHPDDCTKYCVCVDKVAYEEDCLPGLWFDLNFYECNWPVDVSSWFG